MGRRRIAWGSTCSGCGHLQSLHHLRLSVDLTEEERDEFLCSVDECDCILHRESPTTPISEAEWERTARPHEKRAFRQMHARGAK